MSSVVHVPCPCQSMFTNSTITGLVPNTHQMPYEVHKGIILLLCPFIPLGLLKEQFTIYKTSFFTWEKPDSVEL